MRFFNSQRFKLICLSGHVDESRCVGTSKAFVYRAFNIANCTWPQNLTTAGKEIYEATASAVRAPLRSFVTNGTINAAALTRNWFPLVSADVFLSHSHKDKEQAMRCAAWLKANFGLDAFIDSCVWGYADELLGQIDDEYCRSENGETYNYRKRNGSTSHVHMMLASALSAVLDEVECVFFLNTPNSIKPDDAVSKTFSPWIYFEIEMLGRLRRRKPRRLVVLEESFSVRTNKAAELKVEYELPLDNLPKIDADVLNAWEEKTDSKGRQTLDLLYELADI